MRSDDIILSREEWDALSADEQYQLFYWRDYAANRYEEVMALIPECPQHGSLCTPHAEQWVKEKVAQETAEVEHA